MRVYAAREDHVSGVGANGVSPLDSDGPAAASDPFLPLKRVGFREVYRACLCTAATRTYGSGTVPGLHMPDTPTDREFRFATPSGRLQFVRLLERLDGLKPASLHSTKG